MDGNMVRAFGAVGCRPLEREADGEAAVSGPRLVPRHGIPEVGVLCWITFGMRTVRDLISNNIKTSYTYLCYD